MWVRDIQKQPHVANAANYRQQRAAALNGRLARFPPMPAAGNPKLSTSSRSTLPGRGAVQLRSDLRDFAFDLLALGLVADQYCPRSRCFESASSSGRELWGRVACVPSACMR